MIETLWLRIEQQKIGCEIIKGAVKPKATPITFLKKSTVLCPANRTADKKDYINYFYRYP